MKGHLKRLVVLSLIFLSFFLTIPLFASSVNASKKNSLGDYLPEEEYNKYAENSFSFYDPNGCIGETASSGAKTCTAPTGDKITWIGDSYSEGAKELIEKKLPGVDLGDNLNECANLSGTYPQPNHYVRYSKQIQNDLDCTTGQASGLTLLKEIIDNNKLRPYLVFALGTNNPPGNATEVVKKIIDMVNGKANIVFVTAHTKNGDYSNINSAYREAAKNNQNVAVADWDEAAKGKDDTYYISDSDHPEDNGGYEAWTDTIISALPQSCSTGLLAGNTNAEKIWNFFVSANIPGVSDNPAVIAAIIGNLELESGLDPFSYDGGNSPYGLEQDIHGEIKKIIDDAGLGQYWGKGNSAPQDAIDKAIQLELNQMIKESVRWAGGEGWSENLSFVKNLNVPAQKTPEAYAELFVVTYEGACATSKYPGQPLQDSGVLSFATSNFSPGGDCVSSTNWQLAVGSGGDRRTYARKYYDEFSTQVTTSTVSSSTSTSSSGSSSSYCPILAEYRQEVWNEASQDDKEYFLGVVIQEDGSLAGVEGYLNQVIAYGSRHGKAFQSGEDGSLKNWLDDQCTRFRTGKYTPGFCRSTKHSSEEANGWIQEALKGSNVVRFAIGNSSSSVGAGKIVCVAENGKCRDDVDYTVQGGYGVCDVYTTMQGKTGECWGLEGGEQWAEEMKASCGDGSGPGGAAIAQTARDMAWPDENGKCGGDTVYGSFDNPAVKSNCYYTPRALYAENHEKFNVSGNLTDCGGFAITAIRASGADPDFPDTGSYSGYRTSGLLYPYLSSSPKWEEVNHGGDESKLQPGDIAINIWTGGWHHIMVFVGKELGGNYGTWAEGAQDTYVGLIRGHQGGFDANWKVYRIKESTVASSGASECPDNTSSSSNSCGPYTEKDFPGYLQGDSRWAGKTFYSYTMAGGGCGPTTFAEILSGLTGTEITPADVVDMGYPNTVDSMGPQMADVEIAQKYNLETEAFTSSTREESKAKITEYLKNGWTIHTNGNCAGGGGNMGTSNGCPTGSISFGGQGHYVALLTIEGDKVLHTNINDGLSNGNQWHTLDELYDMGLRWMYPNIAIRNPNKTGKNCPGDGDGTLKSGGFTNLSDAEAFIKEYHDLAMGDNYKKHPGSQEYLGGYITDTHGCPFGVMNNCVSFSQWFVNKYASANYQTTSNGYGVVSDMIGLDFTDGKNTPQAYAVFSVAANSEGMTSAGHTGIVLGVNKEKNKIYIAEASCSYGQSSLYYEPHVVEKDLDHWTNNPNITYAYPTNIKGL